MIWFQGDGLTLSDVLKIGRQRGFFLMRLKLFLKRRVRNIWDLVIIKKGGIQWI